MEVCFSNSSVIPMIEPKRKQGVIKESKRDYGFQLGPCRGQCKGSCVNFCGNAPCQQSCVYRCQSCTGSCFQRCTQNMNRL